MSLITLLFPWLSANINKQGHGADLEPNIKNAPNTYTIPYRMDTPWDVLPYVPYSYKLLVPLDDDVDQPIPVRTPLNPEQVEAHKQRLDQARLVKLPVDICNVLYRSGMQHEVTVWRHRLTKFRKTLRRKAYANGFMIFGKDDVVPHDPVYVSQHFPSLDDRLREFWGPFQAHHMTEGLMYFYKRRLANGIHDDWEEILWPRARSSNSGPSGSGIGLTSAPSQGVENGSDDRTSARHDQPDTSSGPRNSGTADEPAGSVDGKAPGPNRVHKNFRNSLFKNPGQSQVPNSKNPLPATEGGSRTTQPQQNSSTDQTQSQSLNDPQTPAPGAAPPGPLIPSALKSRTDSKPASASHQKRVKFNLQGSSTPGFRAAPLVAVGKQQGLQGPGISAAGNANISTPGFNIFGDRRWSAGLAYVIAPDVRDTMTLSLPPPDVYRGIRVFNKLFWEWFFGILLFMGCYNCFTFLSFARNLGSAGLSRLEVVKGSPSTEFKLGSEAAPIYTETWQSGNSREISSTENLRLLSNYEREREKEIEWQKMAYLLELVEDGNLIIVEEGER